MFKAAIVIVALSYIASALGQTPTTPRPLNPEQQAGATAPEDPWMPWFIECIKQCGADDQCKTRICRNTWEHAIRCASGDRVACDDGDRDRAEIERYNAQRRQAPPQASMQDPLMKCLQDTADQVLSRCRSNAGQCPPNLLEGVGLAQKMRCGYSAIQPIEPSQSLNPRSTHCITSPAPGGGWTTTCTQF